MSILQLWKSFTSNTAPAVASAEGLQHHADSSMTGGQPAPSSQKEKPRTKKKSIAELDEEMRQRMSSIAGDGGEAGVEYEDGKPVAMKKSVRDNMFRYI
jgi:hypothetical protein